MIATVQPLEGVERGAGGSRSGTIEYCVAHCAVLKIRNNLSFAHHTQLLLHPQAQSQYLRFA